LAEVYQAINNVNVIPDITEDECCQLCKAFEAKILIKGKQTDKKLTVRESSNIQSEEAEPNKKQEERKVDNNNYEYAIGIILKYIQSICKLQNDFSYTPRKNRKNPHSGVTISFLEKHCYSSVSYMFFNHYCEIPDSEYLSSEMGTFNCIMKKTFLEILKLILDKEVKIICDNDEHLNKELIIKTQNFRNKILKKEHYKRLNFVLKKCESFEKFDILDEDPFVKLYFIDKTQNLYTYRETVDLARKNHKIKLLNEQNGLPTRSTKRKNKEQLDNTLLSKSKVIFEEANQCNPSAPINQEHKPRFHNPQEKFKEKGN
jgi:hypothetical protein